MVADYSLKCYDSAYNGMMVLAVSVVVFFAFGIPLFFSVVLYKKREHLRTRETQQFLGMLYLWDVKLSSVSFTGMVMSIGLSVDYNVHIAHAFLHGKGDTLEQRTKYTLDLMGGSVLKGGLTTFVGTVVLSMASSTAFRIFFKVVFGTVTFGILHGVFLMPVLLGLAFPCFQGCGGHGAKVAVEP